MGRQLKQLQVNPDLAEQYAAAFALEPELKEAGFFLAALLTADKIRKQFLVQVGFTFVKAHSEHLFEPKIDATLKDVQSNPEATAVWL